jgi:hypothetical protein
MTVRHDWLEDRETPRPTEEADPDRPALESVPTAFLALQQTAGNRAVGQLLRKKFDSEEDATTWLTNAVKKKPREDGESAGDYLTRLIDRQPYANPPAHKTANLAMLKGLLAGVEATVRTPTGPSRKRTVTESQLNHIANGEVRDDDSPTGLHTIKGENRVCEWFGNKTNKPFGCYWKAVRSIKGQKVKPKGSTFYPDAWSLDDIVDAIEYAAPITGSANLFEVMAPAKSPGLVLYFNGDSYFPNY